MSGGKVFNRVRRAFFLDSVALMRLSRTLSELPGVEEAALMIGTTANKRILAEAGLLATEGREAGANDLVIALGARSRDAGKAALGEAELLLDEPSTRPGPGEAWQPKTLAAAADSLPEASLALISVPGAFAAAEARKALAKGLHVMVFSDNVSLEDECALKVEARERGLLLMGPDCGTALVAGRPLGFANAVPRGQIGIVAASGTGLQELSSLIARGGKGVSHGIGVGSRDLGDAVEGAMTLMAFDALDMAPETQHIVVVSKPPSGAVAERILERATTSPNPVTVCFLGLAGIETPDNVRLVATLTEAAEVALGGAAIEVPEAVRAAADRAQARLAPGRRWISGLFCGGALCAEAQVILKGAGEDVRSNAPVPGARPLEGGGDKPAHGLVDLGADEFTVGRPHPMIDPAARSESLRRSVAAPDTAAVLVDVVIGFGAHANPADAVAGALAGAPEERAAVVASVCGTEEDPQIYSAQIRTLEEAGVIVAPSNARATEIALELSRRD